MADEEKSCKTRLIAIIGTAIAGFMTYYHAYAPAA